MGTKFILEERGPSGAEAHAIYWLKMIGHTNAEVCFRLDITLDDYYRWYDTLDWFRTPIERLDRALESPDVLEEINQVCRVLQKTKDVEDFWEDKGHE